MSKHTGKYIFVTGGVCSSLGKGLAASSIGALLEARGYNIQMMKIDPYINVDAGTMNPYQHGEVYVTDDGAETDLDLGNYTRFTNAHISKDNSITTGQVYQEVIQGEREGRYLGRTVQVIPHITDCIKQRIFRVGKKDDNDITIVEVGGTVGDIESYPFIEAIRQMIHELDSSDCCIVHLTLIPDLTNGEIKTKPTQHSVKELRAIGLHTDFILCRSRKAINEEHKTKIERYSDVKKGGIISSHDVDSIYDILFVYKEQKLDELILRRLGLIVHQEISDKINKWKSVTNIIKNPDQEIDIAMIGKYIELSDAYKSVDEALLHGGLKHKVKVNIHKFDSEQFDKKQKNVFQRLGFIKGILLPGGFGDRGVLGMLNVVEYARKEQIPFFGICLGLQVMVIEYARNVLGLKEAHSTEFIPETEHAVISLLEEQQSIIKLGGTMRLGANDSILKEHTLISKAYGKKQISERHRHRYEVSNQYREMLEREGLIIAGTTKDGVLVESIQWPNHVWGVGVQFHPEFKSMPIHPHPLFVEFIGAGLANKK